MRFKRGDHVCAMYSTTADLAQQAAQFLAEGLRNQQQCWYVASGTEGDAVGAALATLNVNVAAETSRNALKLISGRGTYIVHGAFDPEVTLKVFDDAIEHAYIDGFAGLRAAADMSWALECPDGANQVIIYEALLRPLFVNCRATGLCLYDRTRMPLAVVDGALSTHPIAGSHGHYQANRFYNPEVRRLSVVTAADVQAKLGELDRWNGSVKS
jgi:chemotaxis family two-component system sensor kinase Cph1